MDNKIFDCATNKENVWAFLKALEPGIKELESHVAKELNGLSDELKSAWSDFVKALSETPNVCVEQVSILNQSKLVEISQKHMVEGSNAVAVVKAVVDKSDIVYLAYMKDDELIETEKNKFVNIKAEALGRDVLELFGEEKLIVLK